MVWTVAPPRILADVVSRIVGAVEWQKEYGSVCKEGKVALLLGKGVDGLSDTVMEEVGECWIGKWWQRRKYMLYGDLSWAQHMHYYYYFPY